MPLTSTSSPAPVRTTGRIRRVVPLADSSVLEVEGADGTTVTTVIRASASATGGRIAAAGLRGVAGVRIDVRSHAVSAVLLGATRTPVRRPIGVGAALALVAAGVPGVVCLEVAP